MTYTGGVVHTRVVVAVPRHSQNQLISSNSHVKVLLYTFKIIHTLKQRQRILISWKEPRHFFSRVARVLTHCCFVISRIRPSNARSSNLAAFIIRHHESYINSFSNCLVVIAATVNTSGRPRKINSNLQHISISHISMFFLQNRRWCMKLCFFFKLKSLFLMTLDQHMKIY